MLLLMLSFAALDAPVVISPDPASAGTSSIDPTVILGAITIIPATAGVVATVVTPDVVLGAVYFTPDPAGTHAVAVDPTVVYGAVTITPAAAGAVAAVVTPTVVLGATSVTPAPASAVAAVVNPTVAFAVIFTPAAAGVVASVSQPTVVLGALALAPAPASAKAAVHVRSNLPMAIADQDWPQLGRNPQRQGYSPVTVAGPYNFAWKWFEVPFASRTQPVIVADKLYIGSIDGKMYCRNALTGAAVWNYDTGGPIRHTAAIEDLRCFVTSMSGKLYSLHAITGAHQWDADIGPSCTAVLLDVDNDRVFACSLTGIVACYSMAGTLIWQVQMGGAVMTSPSLSEDGFTLFGASEDMFAWALNTLTGERRWVTKLTGVSAHSRAPVVYGSSVFYRVQPFEQFHKLLQVGGDDVMALAGGVNGNWATDWANVKPYIVAHLNANDYRKTFHVLNGDTGISKGTAPVLYTFGHNGIPASPIITPTGIYVEYRARHGIQTDTPTTHVTSNYDAEFGVMDPTTFDITGLNTVANLQNRQWRATSDEPAGITKGGDILWIESWERIGGINLAAGNQSGTNIFMANLASEVNTAHDNYTGVGEGGQSRAYGSFFPLANDGSASRPWPKNIEGEGHEIAGAPIASNSVFWKCIGGGLCCIKPTSLITSTQIYNGSQTGAGTASNSNSGRAMSEFVTTDLTTPSATPPGDLRDLLRHEIMDMVRSTPGHVLSFWMQRGLTTGYAWPAGHPTTAGEVTVIKDGVQGNAFWFDPAELLYTCAMAYPYLTVNQKAKLKTWVEAEMAYLDPISDLPYPSGNNDWLHTGKSRMPYTDPTRANLSTFPSPKFHLASFYAIWLWCKNTGDWTYCDNNQTLMRSQYTAFKTNLRYYADIAGLIGYSRIATHLNWTDAASSTTTATTALTNSTGFSTFDSRAGADYKDYFYNDNGGVNPEDGPVFWGLVPEIGLYLAEKTSGTAKQRIMNVTDWTGGLPAWWFTKGGTAHKYLSENGFIAPHAAWSWFLARAYVMGDDQTALRKVFDPSRWAMGDLYLIQRIVALIQAPA